jgi:fatty acid desaturase
MTIFEGLLIAHLLGDWLLQTEWQAQNKRTNWLALLSHVAVYHAIVFIILFFGFKLDVVRVIVAVGALALFHIILDKQDPVRWYMRTFRLTVTRTPERWLMVAVDQSIHLVLLGAATVYLTGGATG